MTAFASNKGKGKGKDKGKDSGKKKERTRYKPGECPYKNYPADKCWVDHSELAPKKDSKSGEAKVKDDSKDSKKPETTVFTEEVSYFAKLPSGPNPEEPAPGEALRGLVRIPETPPESYEGPFSRV